MFIYNKRKFNEYQIVHIESAKIHKVNKEILKMMTKIKKGKPVYNSSQMSVIAEGARKGLDVAKINFYAKLNSYNKPIYNDGQMNIIMLGFLEGLPYSSVELYAKVNSNEESIFDYDQMCAIYYALRWEIPIEDIKIATQLNSKSEPIFDFEQMNVIFHAIKFSGAKENIDIFTKIENGKSVYSAEEIQSLSSFFIHADDNATRQMRECFENGISFAKLKPLLDHTLDASVIRLCRSLYKLEFTENAIDFLLKEGCNYEDLKEIKYIANCIHEFISDAELNFELKEFDMEQFREMAAIEIAKVYGSDIEICEFIEKCMRERIDTEEMRMAVESKFILNENEVVSEKESNLTEEDIYR